MRREIRVFDNGIYPRKLWIVVDSPDTVKDSFLNVSDDSVIDNEAFSGAFGTALNVVEKDGERWKGVVIHFSGELLCAGGSQMVSTISHESVHAANMMFRDIGVRYTMYDDEHFAYLVGWVSRMCWKVLQDYVDKKK